MLALLSVWFLDSAAAASCGEPALTGSTRTLQMGKNRTRTLAEYEARLIGWTGRPTEVQKLLMMVGGMARPKFLLPQFLFAYARRQPGLLRWSDVGAGYALPFREIKRDRPALAARLHLTAVDLFDWDRLGDDDEERRGRADAGPDILDPAFKPEYAVGNLGRLTPHGQHLITAVESFQYVRDKLGTLAALYDRLADDGVLIITSAHYWSLELLHDQARQPERITVLSDVLRTLSDAGILVAVRGETVEKRHTLALVKRPGTRLRVIHPMSRASTNVWGYSWSYYPVPPGQSAVAVAVVP